MHTDSVTIDEANGLFSVKTVLDLTLTRQELSASLECRVETPALENIVSNHLHLDLQVRPTKIALTGVKHHTVQDTKVLLQCEVITIYYWRRRTEASLALITSYRGIMLMVFFFDATSLNCALSGALKQLVAIKIPTFSCFYNEIRHNLILYTSIKLLVEAFCIFKL